jgi:hypothetical protein
MSVAFTFPGQGSQAVGMGKDLAETFAEARAVFDEVDEALGQKLSAIMFEGPEETLTLTANAQPALMAVSIAVMRVLEARGLSLKDQGFLCRRPFARRIFRALRSRHLLACRYRAAPAHPRQCHAVGRSGGRGRHGGDHRPGAGGCRSHLRRKPPRHRLLPDRQ